MGPIYNPGPKPSLPYRVSSLESLSGLGSLDYPSPERIDENLPEIRDMNMSRTVKPEEVSQITVRDGEDDIDEDKIIGLMLRGKKRSKAEAVVTASSTTLSSIESSSSLSSEAPLRKKTAQLVI